MNNVISRAKSSVCNDLFLLKRATLKFIGIAMACASLAFALTATAKTKTIQNLEAGKKQTIVYYGTSLTAANFWNGAYTTYLKNKYGANQVNAINSGLPGKGSYHGITNIQNRVLNHKPDTVFIEFAANDSNTGHGISLSQSQSFLNQIIDKVLQQNPNAEIIIQTMNPAWAKPGSTRPLMDQYQQGHRDVAKQRGALLIDHYPKWKNLQKNNNSLFRQYIGDGIHPSFNAYKRFVNADIIAAMNGGTTSTPAPTPAPIPTPQSGGEGVKCQNTAQCKTDTGINDSWCNVWLGDQPAVCYCGARGLCKVSAPPSNNGNRCASTAECKANTGVNDSWCNLWLKNQPAVCYCGARGECK